MIGCMKSFSLLFAAVVSASSALAGIIYQQPAAISVNRTLVANFAPIPSITTAVNGILAFSWPANLTG
jgi:hypothetical protein